MAKEDILIKHYGVSVNGYDIRAEERCCVQQKNVSISQIVVGIAGDKRQAFLQLVLLNVSGDRSSGAEADFAALVRSVKLDPSDKDFDLVPTSGDGGLDGVFTHLDTGIRPNVFGGMASSAAFAVARLGGKASLWGAVGNDATGERIIADLSNSGIDTSGM